MLSAPARPLALACAVITASVLVAPVAGAHGADQAALESAKAKIAAVERDIEAARSVATTAEARLAEATARLRELEEAVNEAAQALERQELAVDEAAQRVAALERQMDDQLDAFALRAADLFKRGTGVPFEAILDAGSIQHALDRSAYVQALSSSDQASLENITATRTAVDAERERLDAERERLAAMKAEQEQMLAKVAELRRHRALEFASAQDELRTLREHRDDLEAESERIADVIRARQRQTASAARRAAAVPASSTSLGSVSTSGYAWPRCDNVTSEYGYRWGRLHAGIDIDGNTGDPIYASKAGVVIFVGWSGGYGRLTLIDHGDGVVTAYAHQTAQSVSDGQRVSQGQYIGAVGSTGNSTGAHLHFETRVNGDPVDPRRFLPGGC